MQICKALLLSCLQGPLPLLCSDYYFSDLLLNNGKTFRANAVREVSTLPSPTSPRCYRDGNPDTVFAHVAPDKEHQPGMKHKSHLGKNTAPDVLLEGLAGKHCLLSVVGREQRCKRDLPVPMFLQACSREGWVTRCEQAPAWLLLSNAGCSGASLLPVGISNSFLKYAGLNGPVGTHSRNLRTAQPGFVGIIASGLDNKEI